MRRFGIEDAEPLVEGAGLAARGRQLVGEEVRAAIESAIWAFNPHPLRRGSATIPKIDKLLEWLRRFNPHPLRRGSATPMVVVRCDSGEQFQSSPPPKRECNHTQAASGGAVVNKKVSILTPSEEGVQPVYSRSSARAALFQSSPPPKRECNNSHRLPARLRTNHRFNPHPLRRGSATRAISRWRSASGSFQSSPPPKRECNESCGLPSFEPGGCFNPHPLRRGSATRLYQHVSNRYRVSILTPSEEGVQPAESRFTTHP